MFAIALLLAATLEHEMLMPGIELVAPEGYRIERHIGPDFSTYKLRPNNAAGKELSGIGIYAGSFPNTFLGRMDKQPPVAKKAASIAGKTTTWSCWKDEDGPMCETVLSGLIKGNPRVLHIWLMAHSEDELASYRRMASTQIVKH